MCCNVENGDVQSVIGDSQAKLTQRSFDIHIGLHVTMTPCCLVDPKTFGKYE